MNQTARLTVTLRAEPFQRLTESADKATHAMTVLAEYLHPVPLRTGRRGGRSRAEHARRLRLARWMRRRERRHGIPAATLKSWVYLPRATVVD